MNSRLIGRGLEGISPGFIEVQSRHTPGEIEENYKKPQTREPVKGVLVA
jgi:hypothetical protein